MKELKIKCSVVLLATSVAAEIRSVFVLSSLVSSLGSWAVSVTLSSPCIRYLRGSCLLAAPCFLSVQVADVLPFAVLSRPDHSVPSRLFGVGQEGCPALPAHQARPVSQRSAWLNRQLLQELVPVLFIVQLSGGGLLIVDSSRQRK